MKNKFLLILTLLLFANKSNCQSFFEISECLFGQLGFKMYSIAWEFLGVLSSLDEEKLNDFYKSHIEVLYAFSYCMTDPGIVLRYEAEKIVKNFFGLSYKITVVNFEKDYLISAFPKITLKFKDSCDYNLLDADGFFKIKGGTVISEKGMETTFTNEYVEALLKIIGFDIKKASIEVKNKLKSAIFDGVVYVKIYLDKIEIGFIINRDFMKKTLCEGKIIITIEPGNIPAPAPVPVPDPHPQPQPQPQPAFIIDLEKLKEFVQKGCGLGVIVVLIYQIIRFVAGNLPNIIRAFMAIAGY